MTVLNWRLIGLWWLVTPIVAHANCLASYFS